MVFVFFVVGVEGDADGVAEIDGEGDGCYGLGVSLSSWWKLGSVLEGRRQVGIPTFPLIRCAGFADDGLESVEESGGFTDTPEICLSTA